MGESPRHLDARASSLVAIFTEPVKQLSQLVSSYSQVGIQVYPDHDNDCHVALAFLSLTTIRYRLKISVSFIKN